MSLAGGGVVGAGQGGGKGTGAGREGGGRTGHTGGDAHRISDQLCV